MTSLYSIQYFYRRKDSHDLFRVKNIIQHLFRRKVRVRQELRIFTTVLVLFLTIDWPKSVFSSHLLPNQYLSLIERITIYCRLNSMLLRLNSKSSPSSWASVSTPTSSMMTARSSRVAAREV